MAKQQSRASSGRYVSRLTSGALAVVMAGGRGERLKDLTLHRCKPATPFGGKFRIIDFVLSNCVNSGIRQIFLMTQYKGQSLIQHVQRGWSYLRGEFGEFIDVVPAQQQVGVHWYRGTADCVYQNIELIRALHPKHVLVLAGDHIYKMDYGPMIAYHVEKGADITVGVVEVPPETARDFGVLSVTDWNRVTKFTEKPKEPETIPSRPDVALASMGIYVFNARLLEKLLIADATDDKSAHDFGKNVIPAAIDLLHVAAYPFTDVKTRAQAYWRDVGTLDSYYDGHMDLVSVHPVFNLYNREWPIYTASSQLPPAKFVFEETGRTGHAVDSIVSAGVIVSGGTVRRSVISPGVLVHSHALVEDSVLLDDVVIGAGAIVRRAIIDKNVHVPPGTRIGLDRTEDAARFTVSPNGVTAIGKGEKVV